MKGIGKERGKTSRFKATFRVMQRMTWVFFSLLILTLSLYLANRVYRGLQNSQLFQVKKVSICGNHYLTKTDLIYYLGIGEKPNLIALDIKSLCQKLISHPWIRDAAIHRSLPNTLAINIQERVPVALIKAGNLYYVSRDGAVFDKINKEIGCDFPVITGPRGFSEIRAYYPLIRKVLPLITRETSPMISEVHLDLIRGVTLITLSDSLPVRLGLKGLSRRFRRFLSAYRYIRRREITVRYIDCRYTDRIIVNCAKNPSGYRFIGEKREKVG